MKLVADRYEIVIDGAPWTWRAKPRLALEAGRNLKRANPDALVSVRDRANHDVIIIRSMSAGIGRETPL